MAYDNKGNLQKNQWDKVFKELESLYGRVKFLIDGMNVSVNSGMYKHKQIWQVWIDGEFKGVWLDNPDYNKFYFKKTKSALTGKRLKEHCKIFKVSRKKAIEEYRFSYHLPTFTSLRTLRSTWRKNCTDIQIIKIGY